MAEMSQAVPKEGFNPYWVCLSEAPTRQEKEE